MERFVIKPSDVKSNHWACSDTENGILCIFEDKKFNETQEFSFYEDLRVNASSLARLANDMAEWLRVNHYAKLF